jgi:hypothetical protein
MADLAFVQSKGTGGFDPRLATLTATFDSDPTEGNLLLACLIRLKTSGSDMIFTTPPGWSHIATYDMEPSSYQGEAGLYYRIATSGEGKAVDIAANIPNILDNWSMSIVEFSGVDGSDPVSQATWVGTALDNNTLGNWLTATRSGTTPMLFMSWIFWSNVDNYVDTATAGNGFATVYTNGQNKVEHAWAANYATDSDVTTAATWGWTAGLSRIDAGIIGFNGSSAPVVGSGPVQFRFDNTVFGGSQNFTVPLDEMPEYYPVGETIGQDVHISHIGKAWLYNWWRVPRHSMSFNAVGTDTAATLGSLVSEEYGFLFFDSVNDSTNGGTGTFLFDGPYRRRDYGPNMSEFSFNISRVE